MTRRKIPWVPERVAADEAGLRRYEGRQCAECGGIMRFVRNNACVNCKSVSDARAFAKHSRYMMNLDQDGIRVSREVNQDFISALARERSHIQ